MNDFEQRLQRQPLRPLPPSWRDEILKAARAAASASAEPSRPSPPILNFKFLILHCLWPHPKAWAGLAAAWIVILGLNSSATRPAGVPMVARSTATAPVSTVELAWLTEQRRLQRELLELSPIPLDRPIMQPHTKSSPKPQSAVTPSWGEA